MKFAKISIFFTIITLYSTLMVDSYRYLGILSSGAKSHFIFGSALMKALAKKGHEVYVISAFPQEQPIANYHDVPFKRVMQNTDEIFDESNEIITENKSKMDMSETILKDPNVRKLMTSNLKFDVVICEVFFSEALFGFSEHFKAPLVVLAATGAVSWNTEMIGSPSPTSYVPNSMLPYTDHMTFWERLTNLAYSTLDHLILNYYYLRRQAALYAKYFPHLERDMYTVRKNAAAVLLNTHVSLGYPRPYVPNQIEVGGMHIIRQRKPLPKDIEQFIKEAEHGVVYFSVDCNLLSKYFPEAKNQEFLKTFKSLKQRVLWKCKHETLKGKHDNIYISRELPHEDILAHKNIKAFITYGDLLSITESVYHGKPIIGIPICGDQFDNMAKAETQGIGVSLSFKTLNAQDLVEAVENVINNKSYTQRIKKMSIRYGDQAILPLDLAVYWVEHVTRQKGAKYLHCAGLDLNSIQYYNIDVVLSFVVFLLFIATNIWYAGSLITKAVRMTRVQN